MAKRKLGRPPKEGPELEPFTARLTPQAKKRLMALAQISEQPAYTLLEKAFWEHWEHMPAGRREAAEAIVRLVESARDEDA